MAWQPPPPPPRPGASPQQEAKPKTEIDYYNLLQIARNAHPTVIRYAYRFLAAMYHPDNSETGNADKFRMVSDAWRTLSDEGKRQAYDLSLGAKEQAAGNQEKKHSIPDEFKRDTLPNVPKTNLSWNEIELRLAILQILLAARKAKPQSGGASPNMCMDVLNIKSMSEVEFALWYIREKGFIEPGDRGTYMITVGGVDYLTDQLSKTQVLGEPMAAEQRTQAAMKANLPAVRNT